MKYLNYRYIYPPRPHNPITPDELNSYDDGSMVSQIKSNGSNTTIYSNGSSYFIMNRHGQRLTNFRLTNDEIKSIYRGNGNWISINCEYLNKNKLDETGSPFNHKLIIFDILVYDGEYLVGKTFEERIQLLDTLYGQVDSDKEYLFKVAENVYRVKSYNSGFKMLFDRYTPVDLVEGLVLKRKNSKLEISSGPENNWRSQIKCRKATRNYKY